MRATVFPLREISSGEDWYLLHCQPRKEKYAANSLENLLGVSIYLPELKTRACGEIQKRPFFPGYLFVQANLQEVALSRINTMPGVVRLVTFSDEPEPVPHQVVQMISERLSVLEETRTRSWRPGDIVRVKERGSLQDLEMIFVGPSTSTRRVTVLLNLLGRLKEVQVEVEALERVAFSPLKEGRRF